MTVGLSSGEQFKDDFEAVLSHQGMDLALIPDWKKTTILDKPPEYRGDSNVQMMRNYKDVIETNRNLQERNDAFDSIMNEPPKGEEGKVVVPGTRIQDQQGLGRNVVVSENKGVASPELKETWQQYLGENHLNSNKADIEKSLSEGPIIAPGWHPKIKQFLKDNPEVDWYYLDPNDNYDKDKLMWLQKPGDIFIQPRAKPPLVGSKDKPVILAMNNPLDKGNPRPGRVPGEAGGGGVEPFGVKPGAKEWVDRPAIKFEGKILHNEEALSHTELEKNLGLDPDRIMRFGNDGFLTSKGRFVERGEAKKIAVDAGQLSPEQARNSIPGLISEQLPHIQQKLYGRRKDALEKFMRNPFRWDDLK